MKRRFHPVRLGPACRHSDFPGLALAELGQARSYRRESSQLGRHETFLHDRMLSKIVRFPRRQHRTFGAGDVRKRIHDGRRSSALGGETVSRHRGSQFFGLTGHRAAGFAAMCRETSAASLIAHDDLNMRFMPCFSQAGPVVLDRFALSLRTRADLHFPDMISGNKRERQMHSSALTNPTLRPIPARISARAAHRSRPGPLAVSRLPETPSPLQAFEPLRQRADAVDRADRITQRDGAVRRRTSA